MMPNLLWWHRVGQKVVCVRAPTKDQLRDVTGCCHLRPLVEGQVYEVAAVVVWGTDCQSDPVGFYISGLRSEEVLTTIGYRERTYSVRHFGPVRDTSIESLRALLTPTPDAKRAVFEEMVAEIEAAHA